MEVSFEHDKRFKSGCFRIYVTTAVYTQNGAFNSFIIVAG